MIYGLLVVGFLMLSVGILMADIASAGIIMNLDNRPEMMRARLIAGLGAAIIFFTVAFS